LRVSDSATHDTEEGGVYAAVISASWRGYAPQKETHNFVAGSLSAHQCIASSPDLSLFTVKYCSPWRHLVFQEKLHRNGINGKWEGIESVPAISDRYLWLT
jgi:hypothetical protein